MVNTHLRLKNAESCLGSWRHRGGVGRTQRCGAGGDSAAPSPDGGRPRRRTAGRKREIERGRREKGPESAEMRATGPRRETAMRENGGRRRIWDLGRAVLFIA